MQQIIIDIREPREYTTSHVTAAINIPLQSIVTDSHQLNSIAKNSPIIVYCNSGRRSSVAKTYLEQLGFTNVTNGINEHEVGSKLG